MVANKYKVVKDISKLINLFLITLIINSFITFYTIYNFLDFKIFQNKQGIKLKIKQEKINSQRDDTILKE